MELRTVHGKRQRTYSARKSLETALHQLVVRFEKALDQQETALSVS
jgi:hypothetical protein